jgi:hypothetical protein
MLRYTTYKGWNALSLSNGLIDCHVVPDLGGRLMQFSLHGHEYLFVNPALESLFPERIPDKPWMNFGGEKVWPAPQGWDGDGYWPGPPDHILDGGVYECNTENNLVTLKSPVDKRTGLQIQRQFTVNPDVATIDISATFTNKIDKDIRWSVWPVCQVAVDEQAVEQSQIVCPAKKDSKGNAQYKVLHGLANNPQYMCDEAGNLVVAYKYIVGKVGTDSADGWIAYVNRGSGKVLVMNFDVADGAEYPDGTSLQVWTQGEGATYSRGRVNIHKSDRKVNPPYMEMEILSPLVKLSPGESYDFQYTISACTIESGMCIKAASKYGVTVSRIHTEKMSDGLHIKGEFGFFNGGFFRMVMDEEAEAKNIKNRVLFETEVSPLSPSIIDIPVDESWSTEKGEILLSFRLYNFKDDFLEEIEKIKIGK